MASFDTWGKLYGHPANAGLSNNQAIHPDAPAGGGGPGYFLQTVHPDTALTFADPHAPVCRSSTPPPPLTTIRPHDSSIVARVLTAASWEELRKLAVAVLSPYSFCLGMCFGIVEALGGTVLGLLNLLKMLVLAGICEEAQRPLSWNLLESAETLEARSIAYFLPREVEEAQRQCRRLMEELKFAVHNPATFFGRLGRQYAAEYAAKWHRFEYLTGHLSLGSEFEAGRITGGVLLDIVLLILTVFDGVGLAIKVATKIPELFRLAESLKGVEEVLAARRLERMRATAGALEEAGADVSAAPDTAAAATQPAPKKTSLREQYLGRTPSKNSRTGREVQARMRSDDELRENPITGDTEFQASNGNWYPLNQADMSHNTDAVKWWNQTGRQFGPKSPEVREWMLDPNNYTLDHYSINRSQGAQLPDTYLPPLQAGGSQ
jgi:hypothetical protein